MKATEIIFNKNLEMYVPLKDLGNEVYITLSDSLFASEEELTDTYKIEACMQDIELTHIFVLFEQNAEELFGLEFRVEFDIEHGCGIKIRINDGKYDIVEVGTGDVAFC